jgi:hypothetical protein
MDTRETRAFVDMLRSKGVIDENGVHPELFRGLDGDGVRFHEGSVSEAGGLSACLVGLSGARVLLVWAGHGTRGAKEGAAGLAEFRGISEAAGGTRFVACALTHDNALALRRRFPHTAPSPVLRFPVTFGVGDRLGLAGPGHAALFKKYRACPVFAQQSVREVELTGRSYEEVLDAASWAVFQEGYREPWGADGDHLKTEDWVRRVLGAGFTMVTADVSDHIRGEFDAKPASEVMDAYGRVDPAKRREAEGNYLGRPVRLDTGISVDFASVELARLLLMYGEAIDHAERLYRAGVEVKGEGGFDFELSIDEVGTPTTPQAHVFVAGELARRGVRVASLAPRFVGEFQKGIDYIGDPGELAEALEVHAAVARAFGHKVSVHSGSDKFAIFPAVGKCTGGVFHLKTSGTNWLCALKVAAACDPALFRAVFARARETFERARRHYHVTPDLDKVPAPGSVPDERLADLLDEPNARQVLHITYGEILADERMRNDLFRVLAARGREYAEELRAHIGRHLDSLGVKGA